MDDASFKYDKAADSTALPTDKILTAAGEAAYCWSLENDKLSWSANLRDVLKMPDVEIMNTGVGFARYIDAGSSNNRYDAIAKSAGVDKGAGVPYQLQYAFCPHGRDDEERIWVEDCGRWFAGADGKPAKAFGVIRVINERYERERRLTYLSQYDELTGEANRAHLVSILEQRMESAKETSQPFSYMLVAIDDLALINEGYGFDIADEVIAGVSRILRNNMRNGDVIGRVSGNKLGIVLANCDDDQMNFIAQRFQMAVREQLVSTTAGPVFVNLSIGGVVGLRHALTAQQLMTRAHEALDVAKHKKRGMFVAYRASLLIEQTRRQNAAIAQDVISAFNERRLVLSYQPIVNARTKEPQFYEALLRLIRPDGTEVAASSFVPTAEKLGLTRLIDHRVLELAVDTLKKFPDVHLAINVSARTTSDPEWIGLLCALMISDRSMAARLIVEITETSAIDHISDTIRFIEQVKGAGCRIAIDDFGAGHTSFRYLRELMVDVVKIDGSYIQNISSSPDDQIFVKTLVDLSKKLGLQIVAEWVQTAEDAKLLQDWGVDLLQGFLYGSPQRDLFEPAAAREQRSTDHKTG
ncbi:MAG: EAL domain-containing protein [Pseudomonadota bacterium]